MKYLFYKNVFVSLLFFALTACDDNQENGRLQLNGSTMGTSYHITVVANKSQVDSQQLQEEIDASLVAINQQMSTYINGSEISQFNQYSQTDWFPVSNEFLSVVLAAMKAHQLSNGLFDPTIYPLVDLWGFAKNIKTSPPSEVEIQKVLNHMGFEYLKIRQSPPALSKELTELSLDLSAIAKGYGVDVLAEMLKKKGFTDYLVEIGGEIHASGKNINKEPWHIAIEQPDSRLLPSTTPIKSLYLSDQSVATSGDYRNYYEYNGRRYAHTLNPQTGKPAENTLVSVTVIASSTMWADAMATSMMVMGEKKGLAFANEKNLAVFMVMHEGNGYKTIANDAFLAAQHH